MAHTTDAEYDYDVSVVGCDDQSLLDVLDEDELASSLAAGPKEVRASGE